MDLLERREDLVLLLRQRPGHVVTRIGRELGRPELDKTSLAVSRYLVDGQDAGALAVLGPVRMDYPPGDFRPAIRCRPGGAAAHCFDEG